MHYLTLSNYIMSSTLLWKYKSSFFSPPNFILLRPTLFFSIQLYALFQGPVWLSSRYFPGNSSDALLRKYYQVGRYQGEKCNSFKYWDKYFQVLTWEISGRKLHGKEVAALVQLCWFQLKIKLLLWKIKNFCNDRMTSRWVFFSLLK